MIIYETNSPVVLVVDFRLLSDKNFDIENDTNNSVYRLWGAASKYTTRAQWSKLTKVALMDIHEGIKIPDDATPIEKRTIRKAFGVKRDAAKAQLHEYLLARKPRLTLVMQSRSASARKNKEIESAEIDAEGTMSWPLFHAPGSLPAVMGTIFDSPYGAVMGIPNPVNYEFVYEELIRRWISGALAYGQGASLLTPPLLYFRRNHVSEGLLRLRRNVPLSIDLEFIPSLGVITAIGLSDGTTSVSVPWDPYVIGNSETIEPGASEEWKTSVRHILARCPAIIGHNVVGADIPMLQAAGLPIPPTIYDTWIMHGLTYRQYRHGLQECVAQNFLIEPWKVMFRTEAAGAVPSDPAYWTSAPLALREYNCKDAFFTWHLWQELMPKVGLK